MRDDESTLRGLKILFLSGAAAANLAGLGIAKYLSWEYGESAIYSGELWLIILALLSPEITITNLCVIACSQWFRKRFALSLAGLAIAGNILLGGCALYGWYDEFHRFGIFIPNWRLRYLFGFSLISFFAVLLRARIPASIPTPACRPSERASGGPTS